MRFTLALFFIGLIAMTSALQSDVNFFKSLKRKTYGKTLLDTIQIQLLTHSKSERNGVDFVIDALKELQESQAAEQKKDDDENSDFQQKTAANVARLTDEINGLEKQIADNSATISSNEGVIASANQKLEALRADLQRQEQALQDNLDNQASTKAAYVKAFNALSSQITGLADAKQVLQQLVAAPPRPQEVPQLGLDPNSLPPREEQQQQEIPPQQLSNDQSLSFIQVKSALSNIKFQHAKYQGMINVLAQLMTSQIVSDQAIVAKIHDIIDKLAVQLRDELTLLTSNYNSAIANLEALESQLRGSIAQDKTDIQTNVDLVAQKQSENAQLAQANLEHGQQRDSDVQQRTDAVQAGVNRQKSHDQETARRTEEDSVINEVVAIFQSHERFTDDVRAGLEQL